MEGKTKVAKKELIKIICDIVKTIIISGIMIIIIGFVMLLLTSAGSNIYIKNASDKFYTGGWNYKATLNSRNGLIGIVIYVFINCLGFFVYNKITNKIEKYKIISQAMYIVFSVFSNIIMLMFFSSLFGNYVFENDYLNVLNDSIITLGWITFPLIFSIVYIKKSKKVK